MFGNMCCSSCKAAEVHPCRSRSLDTDLARFCWPLARRSQWQNSRLQSPRQKDDSIWPAFPIGQDWAQSSRGQCGDRSGSRPNFPVSKPRKLPRRLSSGRQAPLRSCGSIQPKCATACFSSVVVPGSFDRALPHWQSPAKRSPARAGPCGGMVDANDSKSFVAIRARSSRARGTSAEAGFLLGLRPSAMGRGNAG